MVANGEEYDLTQKVFLAEKKCRLLQNVMYVDCCKQTLGATPPNLCENLHLPHPLILSEDLMLTTFREK